VSEEAMLLVHLFQSTDPGTDNLETSILEKDCTLISFDPTNETFPKEFISQQGCVPAHYLTEMEDLQFP
jgi:hypothetical protein